MLNGSTSSLIDGLLKANPWPMDGDRKIIKIVWACCHPSSLQAATQVNLDTFQLPSRWRRIEVKRCPTQRALTNSGR
jgi:hypothetical protein